MMRNLTSRQMPTVSFIELIMEPNFEKKTFCSTATKPVQEHLEEKTVMCLVNNTVPELQ